jgi:Fic-DOC domain mobile mystery protein B
MGLELDYTDGQTPIDEDEKEGLLIPTITTRGELDEFEQLGVEKAIAWTMERKPTLKQILTEDYIKELHKRMFADVWTWAGEFRTTNKNIGIDKFQIGVELKKQLDDCRYWIEQNVFSADEIAVRLSHRIVSIHPFANGNGRHSRLLADILVSSGFDKPVFSWGRVNLTKKGEARARYLSALQEADNQNYGPLLQFARE